MNQLSQYLIENLLPKTKSVGVFAGSFSPPTSGHLNVVLKALETLPEVDEFIIYVGSGTRDGIDQATTLLIWDKYKKLLPSNVKIEPVRTPITAVYDYAKNNPETEVNWVVGTREGDEKDELDFQQRTKSISKYPNLKPVKITTQGGVSGTLARKAAREGDKEQFFKYLPNNLPESDKEDIWNIITPVIIEVQDEEIKYWALYSNIYNALTKNPNKIYNDLKDKLYGEQFKALEYFYKEYFKDGVSTLNEVGDSTSKPYNYQKNFQNWNIKDGILHLTKYMLEQGLNIKPLPKVKFINDNEENANNPLGKTAYYDPNEKSITLYTKGRHMKDLWRSYSHETIHHTQNLENRLGNINTTNTNEDGDLPKLEEEAYLKGNMIFRNWEDSIKNR